MAVIPVELDGVMADPGRAGDLDGALSEHRKRIRLSLDLGRLISTCGTGTTLAEVGIRISRLVTVAPGDGNSAGSRELYGSWNWIHEDDYASMETVGGGV